MTLNIVNIIRYFCSFLVMILSLKISLVVIELLILSLNVLRSLTLLSSLYYRNSHGIRWVWICHLSTFTSHRLSLVRWDLCRFVSVLVRWTNQLTEWRQLCSNLDMSCFFVCSTIWSFVILLIIIQFMSLICSQNHDDGVDDLDLVI